MTSTNGWLSKIKSRAQSVQETAKTRIEKLTETLDKKLKEAQDDLEKQRSKAEATDGGFLQQQQIWRPSAENADGEILTVPKPVPIDASNSLPTLPESPPVSTSYIEPLTIRHTKGKRRVPKRNGISTSTTLPDSENDPNNEPKRSSTKQRDHRRDITLCLNDIVTDIVNREMIDLCLNDLLDVISTIDELVENVTIIDTSQDPTDADTKESIVSETELDDELNQQNTVIENVTLETDVDGETIEHSSHENSDESIHEEEELPTLTDIEEIPVQHTVLKDEAGTLTNVDDTQINQDDSEDELTTMISIEKMEIEQPVSRNIEIENDDDVAIKRVESEDEALTNIEETHNEQPDSINESTMLTTINQTSSEHTDSEDEQSSITKLDVIPIKCADAESIAVDPISDEVPMLTNIVRSNSDPFSFDETQSIKLHNKTNTPSPSELEDSFNEFTTAKLPAPRPSETSPQSSTDLTDLRKFLSEMEDDRHVDEDPFPSEENVKTLDEPVHNLSERLHSPNIPENIAPLTPSISEISQENIPDSPLAQYTSSDNEPSISNLNERTIEEKKRFSIETYHSIPLGIKVSHMSCSSTYIYICTNDRKLLYTKVNLDDTNQPLKWQQHTELADRLVSSISNRTVWRLLNKRLYSSNDPLKFPPIGSQWNEIKFPHRSSFLSMSINDQCGWYIREDGTLWLIRTDEEVYEPLNVACPFHLNTIFCFSEKVAVTTSDGEILIRVGCTNDCPEGDGWIFIEHNFGPIDDFVLLTNNNLLFIVDKNHRLWLHQWSSDKRFYEVLCGDDFTLSHQRYLTSVNSELLCLTDCENQIRFFSDSLTGIQWTRVEKNTRLQRLIGAFSDENYVWALTTERTIYSSNGETLEKPRQAQYLTHATFVPDNSSQGTILWSLDESCNIYVRPNVGTETEWEQLDQTQFGWSRRLVGMVCSTAGVWAVDDQGYIYFRHGHISATQTVYSNEISLLPPAWITIPGEAKRHRYFAQVFCGPADWMVYATDNKQNVYARLGINEENRVGTSWKAIEDCSALELAISEYSLWLLTSCGEIQCRENISITNPIGTRSTTLSGHFLSLAVSMDDSQVWALDSKRNLLKLDRLTVLFEK